MINQAHISQLDLLTEAAYVNPELADLCFGMTRCPEIMECDVTWIDAANRLLSIKASQEIWKDWLKGVDGRSEDGYKLAVAHMMFGDCDIVITTSHELQKYVQRFYEAMRMRQQLSELTSLHTMDNPLISGDADTNST